MLKLFYLFLFLLSCIPVHKPSMKNPFDGILGYFYGTFPDKDAGNRISSFSFLLEKNPILFSNVSGVISGNDISVTIPVGIDITKLAASFVTTGKRITVNGLAQESGVTINDFTSPVVYSVYADSGAQRDYKVTVKSEVDRNKVITLFAFTASNNPLLPSDIIGVINGNRISVSLPKNTPLSSLIAVFMTNGVKVEVNGVAQASGTTINNFTNPVVYKVYDLDGGSQDYQVKATVGSPQINVKVGTTSYASESTYDFGTQYFGLTGTPVTFTIENTGTGDLALTGGARVALQGEADTNFTYTQPKADVIKAGGSTTFTVTFKPVVNKKILKIVIANDSVATPNYAVNVTSHPSGFLSVGDMNAELSSHYLIVMDDGNVYHSNVGYVFIEKFNSQSGQNQDIFEICSSYSGNIMILCTNKLPNSKLFCRDYRVNRVETAIYDSLNKVFIDGVNFNSGKARIHGIDLDTNFILFLGTNSEIYNISGNNFSLTSNDLIVSPSTGTKLNTNSILITGTDDRAEIYDIPTKTFSLLANRMKVTRGAINEYRAVLLSNGKVLIAGGNNTAELYDPISQSFSYTSNNMNTTRVGLTATLLNDGKVLLAGGGTSSVEIYDAATNSFTPLPVNMNKYRKYHAATLLLDGTVLITGGISATSTDQKSAEIFVP